MFQIFEDHYFFSHSGVAKRSLDPNPEKKLKLAVDTRVAWAAQQKAKRRVKRDLRLQDSDPKWGNMWYLVGIIANLFDNNTFRPFLLELGLCSNNVFIYIM